MEQRAGNAALERLGALTGGWDLEESFPSDPPVVLTGGRSVFEWMRGGQFLIQRTEFPGPTPPTPPDSITIIAFDREKEAYTQHYFDSRGVARLYAMSLSDGVWKLWRDSPLSPLDFSQRLTGSFSDNGDAIRGAWEKSNDGSRSEQDFDLTYRRIK